MSELETDKLLNNTKKLKLTGLLYGMANGVMVAFIGILVKYLTMYKISDILFFRYCTMSILALPWLITNPETTIKSDFFKLSVLRSLTNVLTIFFRFNAYRLLPLGEAQVLIFTNVIFTTLIAKLFLRETVSAVTAIAVCLSMIGALLIAKVPEMTICWDKERVVGVGMALSASFSDSVLNVIARKMNTFNKATVVFTNALFCTMIISAGSMAIGHFDFFRGLCDMSVWVLFLTGMAGFLCSVTKTKALGSENASTYVLARMGPDLLLAFVAQLVIFGEPFSVSTWIGTLLVLIGSLLPAYEKWSLVNR